MQPITYLRPESLAEATDLLAEHGENAVVLAGGQSLVQILKQRLAGADYVVDISGLDALDRVEIGEESLTVGAMVTYERLRRHEVVRERVPVLAEALGTIGDVQIRSRGTLAGGIAQADPQGDPPVVASALDATIHVASADRERTIPATEFFAGLFETELGTAELITAVTVPQLPPSSYSTYRAFAPRKGDYATASLAVILDLDGEVVEEARLTVGSVVHVPTRLDDAEAELAGERLDENVVARAAAAAREGVETFDDELGSAAYKESLVERLTSEALSDAVADGAK